MAILRQYIQTPDVPRLKEAGGGLLFLLAAYGSPETETEIKLPGSRDIPVIGMVQS